MGANITVERSAVKADVSLEPSLLPQEDRWNHVRTRLRFRYGLELTMEEYLDACRQFADGRAINVTTDERDQLEGWVKIQDTWVAAKYVRASRLIATVLPTLGGPCSDIAAVRKLQKESKKLQRKISEALPPNEELSRAKRDTAWFKRQCAEAREHIKKGRIEEGLAILDAAARLPKDSHPGAVGGA